MKKLLIVLLFVANVALAQMGGGGSTGAPITGNPAQTFGVATPTLPTHAANQGYTESRYWQIASDDSRVAAVLDPTGFESPALITSTYDGTAKTITLTQVGGVILWFKGKKINLGTPWISPPHDDAGVRLFLSFPAASSVASASWSLSPWNFYDAQVASVWRDGYNFCHAEHHGCSLDWETHEILHFTIGTRVTSGLRMTAGTYAVASSTISDANNTPGFDSGLVDDEDLPTFIASWTQGTYSIMSWVGTGSSIVDTTATSIASVTGTYPNIFPWSGTAFTRTEMSGNRYANYYQVTLPVTSSVGCQLYRTIIIQPQFQYTSLAAAQAEDFRQLNLGDFSDIAPEFVAYSRMTIVTQNGYSAAAGRFRIEAISYLTGSKATQVSISGLTVPNTADGILVNVAGFVKNLGSTDTTVQLALQTLDALVTGGGTGSETVNYLVATPTLPTHAVNQGYVDPKYALLNGSSLADFNAKSFYQTASGGAAQKVMDTETLQADRRVCEYNLLGYANLGLSNDMPTVDGSNILESMGGGVVLAGLTSKGVYGRSTDYGRTFQEIYIATATYGIIKQISNVGNGVALMATYYATANRMYLLRTADYGLTWASAGYVGVGGNVITYGLQYLGGGYVIGYPNNGLGQVRSTDYGVTLSALTAPFANAVYCSTNIGSGVALVAGANLSIRRTADYGATWAAMATPTSALGATGINYIQYLGGGVVIAAANTTKRELFRSTDYGVTWISLGMPSSTLFGEIRGLEYLGGGIVIISGSLADSPSTLLISKDYGLTWNPTSYTIPANEYFYSPKKISEEIFLIGGSSHKVYRHVTSYDPRATLIEWLKDPNKEVLIATSTDNGAFAHQVGGNSFVSGSITEGTGTLASKYAPASGSTSTNFTAKDLVWGNFTGARYTRKVAHGEGAAAFAGAVLLPDDGTYSRRVLLVPASADYAGIYDVVKGEYTQSGAVDTSATKWVGGLLAPNGKVVFIPSSYGCISEWSAGAVTDVATHTMGALAYSGGVMLSSGTAVFAPYGAARIGLYNTVTQTFATSAATIGGSYAFFGAALTASESVVFAPANATTIDVYNPVTDTVTTGPLHGEGADAFMGIISLPNNKFVLIPYDSDYIGLYDYTTNTYTRGPAHSQGDGAYKGAVLLANGMVVLIPCLSQYMGLYNPVSNTFALGAVAGTPNRYNGGALTPSGKVILAPYQSPNIAEYDTFYGAPLDWCLSPVRNKSW